MDINKLLKNFLDDQNRLCSYPAKRKLKTVVLFFIALKFDLNKFYSEKEINRIIEDSCRFNDVALIRRELYTHKFINRKNDGSIYWLEENQPTPQDLGLED